MAPFALRILAEIIRATVPQITVRPRIFPPQVDSVHRAISGRNEIPCKVSAPDIGYYQGQFVPNQ
jgi:hypothetical protein